MEKPRARSLLFVGMAGIVVLLLLWAFRPEPVPVDVAIIEMAPLSVTIVDDGRTQVKELYVVSAPIAGRVLRLDPEIGDKVSALKSQIAVMQPSGPAFLDERRSNEAKAVVEAAEAALQLAIADVERVRAEVDFAKAEIDRSEALVASDAASPARLDRSKLAYRTAQAQLKTSQSNVRMRRADVAVARAALIGPESAGGNSGGIISIKAPIDGVVLTLNHESEGVVLAGTPLMELGDPTDIEIIADFLSHQAVQVQPGAKVYIEGWGGETLTGRVRLVEPKGFTKISALGIEEQRVNIRIDFDKTDAFKQARIGHGFRVEPRIVLWESASVLTVPTNALFRDNGGWGVFVVEDGTALLRSVEIGQMNDNRAELKGGLEAGTRVVVHPPETVLNGTAVVERSF